MNWNESYRVVFNRHDRTTANTTPLYVHVSCNNDNLPQHFVLYYQFKTTKKIIHTKKNRHKSNLSCLSFTSGMKNQNIIPFTHMCPLTTITFHNSSYYTFSLTLRSKFHLTRTDLKPVQHLVRRFTVFASFLTVLQLQFCPIRWQKKSKHFRQRSDRKVTHSLR